MSNRKPISRAFTLVELLVVIGIIALLVSILLPVTARARGAANGVACLSNLRQLHLVAEAHIQANKGFMIQPPDVDPNSSWLEAFALVGSSRSSAAVCPAVTEFAPLDPAGRPDYLLVGEGGDQLGWNESFSGIERRGAYAWNATSGGKRVTQISHPNEVPTFADSARSVGTPSADRDFNDGAATVEARYMAYSGYWIDRHRQAINVAFLDGHCERVELTAIKLLRWRAN